MEKKEAEMNEICSEKNRRHRRMRCMKNVNQRYRSMFFEMQRAYGDV